MNQYTNLYIVVSNDYDDQCSSICYDQSGNEIFQTTSYFEAIQRKNQLSEIQTGTEFKVLRCTEILGV